MDNVKAEKADAMRRYNRKQKFNYLLHVFAPLLVLLFCCSSKWILIAIETGANCLLEVTSPTINYKPLFPFILINLLIFTIFFLSRKKATQQPDDLYDEHVTNITSSRRRITAAGEDSPAPKKLDQETNYDKQIVCSSPKEQDTETTLCPVQTDTVIETNEEEKGLELVVVEDLEHERQPSVHDKMSDMEFNVVVSTYIYKQNKAWWQERIAGQRKENKDNMGGLLRG